MDEERRVIGVFDDTGDKKFFVAWPKPHRPHQVRLEGGDCSSDSYCYP